MNIYENITELIGNTPLFALRQTEKALGLKTAIFAKLEYFNPAGSVKDRIAKKMIADAEKSGALHKGSVIIEPTSGNTGIGLAAIAASKGYRVIFTMPETMSVERRKLLRAYGAEIVLTEGALGMTGSIQKAQELAASLANAYIPGQFVNPSNPQAHYETTGPEIWRDTDGKVDILVACAGTGGTISGTGLYLREKKPDIYIAVVEPSASPMLSKGEKGSHKIQGIGAGFIPDTLDTAIYNEIITIDDADAFSAARDIARVEGLFVGISSGAAVSACLRLAKRPENEGKTIVTILPDTGERYLSADLVPQD